MKDWAVLLKTHSCEGLAPQGVVSNQQHLPLLGAC